MIQGIYLATQSMSALMDQQDQIAHNLANVNTTGYKQSSLFVQTFQKYLQDDQGQVFENIEIKPDAVHIDYSEGTMKHTGNNADLMIKGDGFFTVMTPDGIRYTRNGNFSLNAEGYLVTSQGFKVMSTGGYVRIDKDNSTQLFINERGEVVQNDEILATLRIADFHKPYRMSREGDSFFRPLLPDNPEQPAAGYAVKQGYLETSNVSAVSNMVRMIAAYRHFEADQRALMSQDQTLEKAVNEVGRVS